jgi:hypothetical protein
MHDHEPPHCLTQKFYMVSQLPSSWMPTLEVALDESHINELEHKDCQPPQGMWHFCTSGKKEH